MLGNCGHTVEAAQRFLEAKERYAAGSELWARATANAFSMLRQKECSEVAKPEWWHDEGLKALSASVVRAAPNYEAANIMRAVVLSRAAAGAWELGPRSAVELYRMELKEAATHYDQAVALCPAPAGKAELANLAMRLRSRADGRCEA